jgi:hypothetical protein
MVKGAAGLALNHSEPVEYGSIPLLARQLTIHAEVEQGEGPIAVKDCVPRMKIGMKEPIGVRGGAIVGHGAAALCGCVAA